jgi:hypothetical protein
VNDKVRLIGSLRTKTNSKLIQWWINGLSIDKMFKVIASGESREKSKIVRCI